MLSMCLRLDQYQSCFFTQIFSMLLVAVPNCWAEELYINHLFAPSVNVKAIRNTVNDFAAYSILL